MQPRSSWVLIICPLGAVATSKAPHAQYSWVPKQLNKVHTRAYNSSYTAPTNCCPPGRKHSANNETSPAPAPIIHPLCFKVFPNGTEGEVKRIQVCRVKSDFDVCFWSLCFEIVFFAPGVVVWPPKQDWQEKQMKVGVFSFGRKAGSFEYRMNSSKSCTEGGEGVDTHTHTRTHMHT